MSATKYRFSYLALLRHLLSSQDSLLLGISQLAALTRDVLKRLCDFFAMLQNQSLHHASGLCVAAAC